MVCILNRLVGWVIYTIKSGLYSCQGPNITFFDAIDNFFHNYLPIIPLSFVVLQPVKRELVPFPLDKKRIYMYYAYRCYLERRYASGMDRKYWIQIEQGLQVEAVKSLFVLCSEQANVQ